LISSELLLLEQPIAQLYRGRFACVDDWAWATVALIAAQREMQR